MQIYFTKFQVYIFTRFKVYKFAMLFTSNCYYQKIDQVLLYKKAVINICSVLKPLLLKVFFVRLYFTVYDRVLMI